VVLHADHTLRVLCFDLLLYFCISISLVDTGSFVGRQLLDALSRWRDQAKGESGKTVYRDGMTDETTDLQQCMYRIYMSPRNPYSDLYYTSGETSERSWQLCLRKALSMGIV